MLNYATLLTQEQIERIHVASLEILERVGLLVRNEKARVIFARNGCKVEADTQIVRFPTAVVEQFSRMMTPEFTFFGRDPNTDRTIPHHRPLIVTGSSAPDIIDPVSGRSRRARSEDIARIAHLINELPSYDVFSISTLAEDAPPGQFTLARLYPAVKYCAKPVRSTTKDMDDTQAIMHLTIHS
jgi:trimethylamine--corrinoid protein Co-methyltransferase